MVIQAVKNATMWVVIGVILNLVFEPVALIFHHPLDGLWAGLQHFTGSRRHWCGACFNRAYCGYLAAVDFVLLSRGQSDDICWGKITATNAPTTQSIQKSHPTIIVRWL